MNFVIEGILGQGVAYQARFDPRVHRFGERDQLGMMGEMQFARLRLELTASVAPSPLDSIR